MLRRHVLRADGSWRDSVVFSILVDEWPSVRDGLLGPARVAHILRFMSELTAPDPAAGARAYELDRAHVFHSWSAQALITRWPSPAREGSYFWDYDGNRYLDFSSQLVNVNIGHQHPKVVAAIQEQAARLCTIAPQHANDQRSEAARLIVERAPEDLEKVFFTNGGADAIENAVRMARLHTGRHKVLTDLPQLPRQHRHRDQDDRRPAALAQRRRRRPVSCTSSAPTPTARRSGRSRRSRSATARSSTSSRSSPSRARRRSRRWCWRRSPARPASWSRRTATSPAYGRSATGTASSTSPTR